MGDQSSEDGRAHAQWKSDSSAAADCRANQVATKRTRGGAHETDRHAHFTDRLRASLEEPVNASLEEPVAWTAGPETGPTLGPTQNPEPSPRRQLRTYGPQRAESIDQGGVAPQLTAPQQPGEQTLRPVSSAGKIGERQRIPC